MNRGRPRSFDQDLVIEKAMRAFWKDGYEKVSMDFLCRMTKLSKPSFYNAFKSKEDLFLVCVERYQIQYADPLLGLLIQEEDPIVGVGKMLAAAAKRFRDPKFPAGCLIMTGALEAKGNTTRIDRKLDELQENMLNTLTEYLKSRGKYSAPRLAAQFLLSQLYAMAMFSRTNPKIFNFEAMVLEAQAGLKIRLEA